MLNVNKNRLSYLFAVAFTVFMALALSRILTYFMNSTPVRVAGLDTIH